MNHSPEGAQGSARSLANSKTPLTDKFYGCPPPESGKDWQTRGTRQERDFARQLERQLAQSEERVAKLEAGLKYIAALHASRDTLLQEMTHDKARALLSSSKTN